MGRRLLLVEGANDEHVMYALLKRHAVPQVFEVKVAGNVDELLALLLVLPKASDIDRIAAVLDADEDLSSRWASLRSRLARAGYRGVPELPAVGGTIVQHDGLPDLGVWLMPDNRLPGILEDFLSFLVPSDDRCLPLVDGFLGSIPAELCRFPAVRRPKARIHAWLAVQEEPGRPLGQAISFRYLDAHAAAATELIAWIRRALVD